MTASLGREGGRSLARARLVAASFVAGSLFLPAVTWVVRPRLLEGTIASRVTLVTAAIAVAVLTAGALAIRGQLDAASLAAPDEEEFRARRQLMVTMPCALAEVAAVVVALLGAVSGFSYDYLALLAPPLVALWVAWPRRRVEAEAEARFRGGGAAVSG